MALGILPIQFPFPNTGKNSVNRIMNTDDDSEEEEDVTDAVWIGVQEAQNVEDIEKDKEYKKTELECQKLKVKLMEEYSNVFAETLKPGDKCNVPPVKIELRDNVNMTPTKVKCLRDIHIQIRAAADEEIKTLLAARVIAEG